MITKIQSSLGNLKLQARNNQVKQSNPLTKTNNVKDSVSFGNISPTAVYAMDKQTTILFKKVEELFWNKKSEISKSLISMFKKFVEDSKLETGMSVFNTNPNGFVNNSFNYALAAKTKVNGFDVAFQDAQISLLHQGEYFNMYNALILSKDNHPQTIIFADKMPNREKILIVGDKIAQDDKTMNETVQQYLKMFLPEVK